MVPKFNFVLLLAKSLDINQARVTTKVRQYIYVYRTYNDTEHNICLRSVT